jgi:Glycosyl transferases group 1
MCFRRTPFAARWIDMAKICLFYWHRAGAFAGHHIEQFEPQDYFGAREVFEIRDLLTDGWNGFSKRRALLSAAGIDKLYRQRDPRYLRMVDEFVERFRNFDLIVMAYNFIHPDILVSALAKPIKVLGFIDDPYSTYQRGIPFLWAFDGAFHISPSYNETTLFPDALRRWGSANTYWWPLTQPLDLPPRDAEYFEKRDVDLVYIGNPHPDKIGRLTQLKRKFGDRFRVHGRWRLGGMAGWTGLISGKPIYWRRVGSLSQTERSSLYARSKIGFNMHVSETAAETGNMRMYELPSFGVMQVCDRAGCDAHEKIFEPDKEAVFYDSMPDAIGKIEYYLANDAKRVEIAMRAYERVRRDYRWEDNLRGLIEWGLSIPRPAPR